MRQSLLELGLTVMEGEGTDPADLDGRQSVEPGHGVEAMPLGVLRHAAVPGVSIGQRQHHPHPVLSRLVDHPVQALPVKRVRARATAQVRLPEQGRPLAMMLCYVLRLQTGPHLGQDEGKHQDQGEGERQDRAT